MSQIIKASTEGLEKFLILPFDFSTTTVAKSNVTGLSFPVTVGNRYLIKFIGTNRAPATNRSGRIGFVLTSGIGTIRGYGKMQTSTTAEIQTTFYDISSNEALAGSFLNSTAVPVANQSAYIILEARFTPVSSGTFQLVWGASNAGVAAILEGGSLLTYKEFIG
jgi:hypothetical protein